MLLRIAAGNVQSSGGGFHYGRNFMIFAGLGIAVLALASSGWGMVTGIATSTMDLRLYM